jgi:hypothetical protein
MDHLTKHGVPPLDSEILSTARTLNVVALRCQGSLTADLSVDIT